MFVRLLAFAVIICLGGTAKADIYWSISANTCAPTSQTIKADNHMTGVNFVRHAAAKVGTITFNCAIPLFSVSSSKWRLRMTYLDSTGRNVRAKARARIYGMGVMENTPDLLATVSSDSSAETELHSLVSPVFTNQFTFQENLYWVSLELDRGAAGDSVIVYSLALEQQVMSMSPR